MCKTIKHSYNENDELVLTFEHEGADEVTVVCKDFQSGIKAITENVSADEGALRVLGDEESIVAEEVFNEPLRAKIEEIRIAAQSKNDYTACIPNC